MDEIQIEVIASIIKIFEIDKDEVTKINDDFHDIMDINSGTTIDMIRACKVYDNASFIAGCMVSTSIIDLVRIHHAEKLAERDRLEGNHMDVV